MLGLSAPSRVLRKIIHYLHSDSALSATLSKRVTLNKAEICCYPIHLRNGVNGGVMKVFMLMVEL